MDRDDLFKTIADISTQLTNIEGVYAVGDAVKGENTVIQAMGESKRTAKSIDRYIREKKR